jgi:chromate reductase, NAD(P)H dehydrogenase (quinone)
MATQSPIKLLGISGSLRKQSYNSGALRAIPSLLPDGMTFEVAELADVPFYNADVEQTGFPDAVKEFRARVAGADALIFAVPEYNFSLSGVLKNALEWLSRPPNPPVNGKPCAVFGASVSPLGTARGQFHFRHVCVSLNMVAVNVPHVDITNAKTKFDAQSQLTDTASLDALRQLLQELKTLALRLRASQQPKTNIA